MNGITSLDLIPFEGSRDEGSVATKLINMGYAVRVEEPYCSRENNAERKSAMEASVHGIPYHQPT